MISNPSLADIAFLVGQWSITLSEADFIPEDAQNTPMIVEYRWIEGNSAIAVRQGEEEAELPNQTAIWIIGRDDKANIYTVLYSDNRGVSRVYNMTFKGNVWKMWRDSPDFSQRFEGQVSADKNKIETKWEKSTDDGKTWQQDFKMHYTRVD